MKQRSTNWKKGSKSMMFLRIILLRKKIIKLGGQFGIIHKFAFGFMLNNIIYLVKINLMDGEWFLLDKKQNLLHVFKSFTEFTQWIENGCELNIGNDS